MDISAADNILRVSRKSLAIVVNTQTPNRQLWYSSTKSGPQRYNWIQNQWINSQEKELKLVF